MTDKLLAYIQSGPHRMTLAQMCKQFKDMEDRILADAKVIKAAEELADRMQHLDDTYGLAKSSLDALAAYRAAVSERDG